MKAEAVKAIPFNIGSIGDGLLINRGMQEILTKNFTIKKQKSRKEVENAITHTSTAKTRHLLNSRENDFDGKENYIQPRLQSST
jgi:hypothetical protein